jgi:lipid-binding SYLF domain-containing protein
MSSLSFTLDQSIDRGVKMLNEMVNPQYVDADKAIPLALIRNCEGLAFLRIYKAGFLVVGGNFGGGCVIAKVKDASQPRGWRWSAPSAVSCGGLGGGFVLGAEAIDSIIICNTPGSIRAFTGQGQVTLGGNVSLAVGPVGRDIEVHAGASSNKEIVAAYSYSSAKGAYIGGSLEGAFVKREDAENRRFYASDNATAENLLDGTVQVPTKAMALANELDSVLKM